MDADHKKYHANCTIDSNNVEKGGAVAPSPTTASIYAKSKDLSPFLKALYETEPNAVTLAVMFSNSGAGASVVFPHVVMDATISYESIGCEWMRNENPYKPGKPIGTDEEILRCHRKGETVSNREYNPLERGWCMEQALNPDKVHYVGPYLDAWKDHFWLMALGQAVYDRKTKEFTGCTLLDISVEHITRLIESINITDSSSNALVRWDDEGTVIYSPKWDIKVADRTTTVSDPKLGIGISKEDFVEMKNLVDFSAPWNFTQVYEAYANAVIRRGSTRISAYPVPMPPEDYDESYRPEFMIISIFEESDIFQSFDELDRMIQKEKLELILFMIITGF
eukprot:15338359-Ditylum_brightwellii.AAC.1